MGYDKKHWRGVESGAGEAQCIASGTADVAYVGGPGAPYREYAGLTWAGTPRPMVLSVGSLLSNDGTYKGWSGEAQTPLLTYALQLEYGSASALTVVWADIRTGAVNVPPCESLRASIVVYSGTISVNTKIQLALTDGFAQDADIPTFTTRMVAGRVPQGARAVELATPGSLVVDGDTVAVSDWTVVPAVQAPPYSPVRINGYNYVFTRAPASTLAFDQLRFWLAL